MKSKTHLGLGSTIFKKLDEFLDEKQKSKEFKDVGVRVKGSKKELSAYKTVVFADLNDIEADDLMAQKLVVKDRVYPVVDIAAERAKGVSSGATFLKVEIRKACSAKAPNSRYQRAIYVKFIERMVSDLDLCMKPDDIWKVVNNYDYLPEEFFVVSKNEAEKSDELKRISIYGNVRELLKKTFGVTLHNIFRRGSESAAKVWAKAKAYEPISKDEATKSLKNYKDKLNEFIYAENSNIEKVKEMDANSVRNLITDILGNFAKDVPKDLVKNRDFMITHYERRIKNLKDRIANPPEYCFQRDSNWQWFEEEKQAVTIVRTNERQINKGIPLTHIKRTGGITIPEKFLDNSKSTNPLNNPITSVFGFKSVQFGNAINDATSREHVRHFLSAVTDLAEILDIDLKQLNQIGDLSIAFASRGAGRYAAHYEFGAKIINMTNKRGDGSLAHEWGHYLDNIMTMLDDTSVNSIKMATDCVAGTKRSPIITEKSQSTALFYALKDLMNFIHRGKEGVSKGYLVRYIADPEGKSGRVYTKKGNYEQVEPKGTAKETFDYWQERTNYFNERQSKGKNKERQLEIIGRLVADLGLPHYDLFIPPHSSDFLASSSLMQSEYWTRDIELFARSWECYIFDKLKNSGRENNYLVSSKYFDETDTVSGQKINVYPEGKERAYFVKLYDNLIDTLKREYNLKPFTPFSNVRKDEYIEFEETEGTEGTKYNYTQIRKSLFELKL